MSKEPETVKELAAEWADSAMRSAFANTLKGRDHFPVGVDFVDGPDPDAEWVQVAPGRHRLVFKNRPER